MAATAVDVQALQQAQADLARDVDQLYVIFCAVLVFFMQAGFAMLEAGAVRLGNVLNILLKNLLDVCVAGATFWLIGYGLAFGATTPPECEGAPTAEDPVAGSSFDAAACVGLQQGNGAVGADVFLAARGLGGTEWVNWFFQFAFAATAATIVSGSMAERTRFESYVAYTAVFSALVFPIAAHWVWSTGGWLSGARQVWIAANVTGGNATAPTVVATAVLAREPLLSQVGLIDFSGCGPIHIVGGVAGLIGTAALGPRHGRFGPGGEVNVMQNHNITLMSMGVWILWLGWYGFNAGSTLGVSGGASATAGRALVTTTISGCFGCFSSLLIDYVRHRVFDVAVASNGVLAGLVSITAGCATLEPWGAAIAGLVGGAIYLGSAELMLKLKLDDPLDAAPIHFGCGVWGLLAAGLFSTKANTLAAYGAIESPTAGAELEDYGLFTGGHARQLGVQALGALVLTLWTAAVAAVLFLVLKRAKLLRISLNNEIRGLDISHHGGRTAYDFRIQLAGDAAAAAGSGDSSSGRGDDKLGGDGDASSSDTSSDMADTKARGGAKAIAKTISVSDLKQDIDATDDDNGDDDTGDNDDGGDDVELATDPAGARRRRHGGGGRRHHQRQQARHRHGGKSRSSAHSKSTAAKSSPPAAADQPRSGSSKAKPAAAKRPASSTYSAESSSSLSDNVLSDFSDGSSQLSSVDTNSSS